MGCLDENTVVDFVEGRLSQARREVVEQHLAGCGGCRSLVARTAEAFLPTGTASGKTSNPVLCLPPLRGLRPGDRVGRYEVRHRVGAGAMGVVYAAEDTSLRRMVALKLLRASGQPGLEARLLREARAASVIRHPNVVPIHDVLELDDGSPVLVMDLLVGEALRARIEREGRLVLQTTISILIPVVSALEAAHALGVVHRDLKPDNIFLSTTDAGELDVKIVDFGVAKLTAVDGPAAKTAGLTETGALVGTPYYMAPEQAFGEKDLDPRADLFAVGVIFFECLTGVRPTEASNVGQVLKLLAHLKFPDIRDVDPDVPEWVAAIIDELLCDREKRIQTAGELRKRLEWIEGLTPATAKDVEETSLDRISGSDSVAWPRHRFAALVLGILLLGVAVAFGLGQPAKDPSDFALTSASHPPDSSDEPPVASPPSSPQRPPSSSAPALRSSQPPRNTGYRRPVSSPAQSAHPSASASQPGGGRAKLLTTPPF